MDRAIIEFPCSSSRFFPPLNPASWWTTSARSSPTSPPRLGPQQRAYSGEYHPSLDVVETSNAVEIVVDVAGVPREAVRVLFRGDVLIVAGEKAPPPTTSGAQLSSARAWIRPLRARRAPERRIRDRTGASQALERRVDDHSSQARRSSRPGADDSDSGRHAATGMNILFIGDIVGRPGRELIRKGLRGAHRSSRRRFHDRQRRERRRGFRCDEGHRRRAARLGRRCHDVRQSHLRQARGHPLHHEPTAPAASGQLPCRRRQVEARISRRRVTAAPSASSTSWGACS